MINGHGLILINLEPLVLPPHAFVGVIYSKFIEGLVDASTAEFASQIINPIYRLRDDETEGPSNRLSIYLDIWTDR